MLLSLSIFLLYVLIILFILYRYSLKPGFALSFKEAGVAFSAKIIAGCLYGYFFLHFYGGDDTWLYHNESLKEYALLKSDPLHFFTNDIVPEGYATDQLYTIFDSSESYAKDLAYTLLIKTLAVFNLFSGGRYYVNAIFYNVIVFFGCYSLFKTVSAKYPAKRITWLLFIFFFPPLLFWTSGIRKDGLCFAIACGLLYQLYYLFEKNFSGKHLVYFFLLFCLLFLLRSHMALSMIPIIIAYTISSKFLSHSLVIFFVVAFLCSALFFSTSLFSESFDLPQKMADRQHAFLQLSGNSYMQLDSLDGTFISYCRILPQALNHVFLRPYITEAKGMLYLGSFIEILFFCFLAITAFIKLLAKGKNIYNDPLMLSFVLFAFLNYMIIGYTVPFLGAIVRYKAGFEIFFIIVLLQLSETSLESCHFRNFKKDL